MAPKQRIRSVRCLAWADGVFLLHAGRKDFFDTLNGPFGAVLKSAYASVWVGSISVGLGMGCSL